MAVSGRSLQGHRAVHRHQRIQAAVGLLHPRQVQPQPGCRADQFGAQEVHLGAARQIGRLAGITDHVVDMLFAVRIADVTQMLMPRDRGAQRKRAEHRRQRRLFAVVAAEAGINQRQEALARGPVGPGRQTGQIHDRLRQVVQRHRAIDHLPAGHRGMPQAQRYMRGAVPLAHLVKAVVGAKVEAVVRDKDDRGVPAKGRSAQRVEEAADLVVDMRTGGEIAAHHLPPGLVPRLFRGPGPVDDIGHLVDGHPGLGPVVIVGMGRAGPDDLRRIIHLVEPVRAGQVVMRMLEAQLDQVAAGRVGAAEEVDGILRHRMIVEGMVICAVVIRVVHPGNARPRIQIGMDLAALAGFLGRDILVEQQAPVVLGHRLVVRIGLAGGEGMEPRAAQVMDP